MWQIVIKHPVLQCPNFRQTHMQPQKCCFQIAFLSFQDRQSSSVHGPFKPSFLASWSPDLNHQMPFLNDQNTTCWWLQYAPNLFHVKLGLSSYVIFICPIWSNLFHLVPTLKEIQKSKRHLKMMEKKISNKPSIPILFLASFGLNPQFAESPVLIIFIGYHPAVRGTSRLAIYLMTPGGKLPLYHNKSSVYHIFSCLKYVKSPVLLVKSSFLLVN